MSAMGIPRHIATLDPRNVEHLLKSKKLIFFFLLVAMIAKHG